MRFILIEKPWKKSVSRSLGKRYLYLPFRLRDEEATARGQTQDDEIHPAGTLCEGFRLQTSKGGLQQRGYQRG